MLVVYTGDGKGKTSACVGQAIRALGQDMQVAFGQFIKRAEQGGEQKMLASLLKDRYLALGPGFFLKEEQREQQRTVALALLDWAKAQMPEVDMLILDEAVYALGYHFITEEELCALIEAAAASKVHLILSGRNAPEWLIQKADIVSEIHPVKHVYQKGGGATKGIEY